MFQPLFNTVKYHLKKRGIYAVLENVQFLEKMSDFYLENYSFVVKPKYIKNKKAYFQVRSSEIAHQCFQHKQECMEFIQKEGKQLTDIIFHVS